MCDHKVYCPVLSMTLHAAKPLCMAARRFLHPFHCPQRIRVVGVGAVLPKLAAWGHLDFWVHGLWCWILAVIAVLEACRAQRRVPEFFSFGHIL